MSTVALVSKDNGVGLTVDMQLLETMLISAGHSVGRVDWRASRLPKRVDVAMFLELWNPNLARYAAKTVGVFNLEWFQPGWAKDLSRIDQLWAKSIECHNVFTQRLRLKNSTYTGFLSRDLMDATVERQPTALHLRGHSDFKNTNTVIETWRRDPKLPPLTIISSVPLDVPPHVRVLGRIPEDQLRREMNAATFHICPSRAEGWGHYITEALSVGAFVITTNASPMNEHIQGQWGLTVNPTQTGRHGMVGVHGISARVLGEAVRQVVCTPPARRADMSKLARQHFESRNASFTQIALDLLTRI